MRRAVIGNDAMPAIDSVSARNLSVACSCSLVSLLVWLVENDHTLLAVLALAMHRLPGHGSRSVRATEQRMPCRSTTADRILLGFSKPHPGIESSKDRAI
jgi:hypothetical protein